MQTPWWKKAVLYQIYPRSFKDSNGDGVGDLAGIIQKIDYLKELGVGAIWLSPVYKSPMVDFGYDISNHTEIDPIFGTLEDFKALLHAAHQRSIKLIMDFVPNHTSNQHPWFLESKSAKNNPKRNWYIWADAKQGSPPNNWLSVFGGSAWQWEEGSGQCYLHSFAKEQPDLNWANPEVREAQFSVLKFWLDLGVDGFRVDVIHWLRKDDQLRDDPINAYYMPGKEDPYHQFLHIYSQGQDQNFEIVKGMSEVLGQYPDKFLLTELWADTSVMAKYYQASDDGRHAPFNLNLIGMPWDACTYRKFIEDFEAVLRPQDWPNYILGNHDQSRVATRLGPQRARLAAMLQFTARGMPILYYGEELGMEDGLIPQELAHDPFEKNLPGFKLGRDPERTPMQWENGEFAGFSAVKPWLPVPENYTHINVQVEEGDTRSHLNLYKQLIKLRGESAVFLEGKFESLDLKNDNVLAFYRKGENKKNLVLLNFSGETQIVSCEGVGELLLNTFLDRPRGEKVSLNNLHLRGHEGMVLKA